MHRWLALLVLGSVLFFVGLGARELWDQDEGMHAATSKEMVRSGDWVTPTFNGENFYDKPVLFTWMVAASLATFGMNEWAARLPAALCGLLGLLGTYALGRRLFGEKEAFLGAVVLASSGGWVVLSRSVVHDIALAVIVVFALLAFWIGYRDEERRWGPWLGFWALTGLAILAKGPVGLMPPFLVALFLLARRELGVAWRMRPVVGALVVLAIAAPWYVAIALQNPDYTEYFLTEKVFGSLVGEEGAGKTGPVWYYVPAVVTQFLPWILFLPVAWLGAWRARSAETTLLMVWAVAVFVLFSLATAKLGTYVFPMLPALALLVGRELAGLTGSSPAPGRRTFAVATGLWALAGLAGLALALGVGQDRVAGFDGPVVAVRVLGGLAAVGAAAVAWCFWRREVPAGIAATVVSVAVLCLGFEIAIAPSMEPYRSSRSIGRAADALLPPGAPISTYKKLEGLIDSALFYTDREARLLAHRVPLREALRSSEPVLIVSKDKDYRKLEEHPKVWRLLHVVERHGNKLLMSNRPAEEWHSGKLGAAGSAASESPAEPPGR